DAAVLNDADLAMLAAEPQRYKEYKAAVRAEYAHIPTEDYLRARIRVIERLLARRSLFLSPLGAAWEEPARQSLDMELHRLRREQADLAASCPPLPRACRSPSVTTPGALPRLCTGARGRCRAAPRACLRSTGRRTGRRTGGEDHAVRGGQRAGGAGERRGGGLGRGGAGRGGGTGAQPRRAAGELAGARRGRLRRHGGPVAGRAGAGGGRARRDPGRAGRGRAHLCGGRGRGDAHVRVTPRSRPDTPRSEEHTSELQSRE